MLKQEVIIIKSNFTILNSILGSFELSGSTGEMATVKGCRALDFYP